MSIQFNFTTRPSTVICYDLDNHQFFNAWKRIGALFNRSDMQIASGALQEVIDLDNKAQATPSKLGSPDHYVKLRSLYIDDENGEFTLNVDYLYDSHATPLFDKDDIKRILNDGTVQHLGHVQLVKVSIKSGNFAAENFSPVADQFYD
ncbi:MAG: hypothetical protein V4443_01455 [Pseudomonadota bacterium]